MLQQFRRAIGVAIVRGNAKHWKLGRLHYIRSTPEEAAAVCRAHHSDNRWKSSQNGRASWYSYHEPEGYSTALQSFEAIRSQFEGKEAGKWSLYYTGFCKEQLKDYQGAQSDFEAYLDTGDMEFEIAAIQGKAACMHSLVSVKKFWSPGVSISVIICFCHSNWWNAVLILD